MSGRITLERAKWYGLTMYPGYAGSPYHSPIRVDEVTPLGGRQFELRFLNLFYAAGLQDFSKILRTLRRGKSHLVAEETQGADRTYVICELNASWVHSLFPSLRISDLFRQDGSPDAEALIRLAPSSY